MKKFHVLLTLAIALSMTAFAQTAPKGKMLPYNGLMKQTTKSAVLKAPHRAAPPEGVTVETNWTLTGNYINNSTPYANSNEIAVAFDGNTVYVKGLVYLCPDAWIQGTIDGATATFANAQYAGMYGENMIYACGYDGSAMCDIVFDYDAEAGKFTLTNYYLENVYADQLGFFFYSYDLVLQRTIPAAATPTGVAVEPATTTANVSWTENGTATSWNLRYRTLPVVANLMWDFEDANQLQGWSAIDSDGDDQNWMYANARYATHSGNGVMISASYYQDNDTTYALTPDNWLISPKVPMGGKVSFWACGQDTTYYAENFAVYLLLTDEMTGPDDFIKISDDITAGKNMTEYVFDLSQYADSGRIAIRHYGSTDMFYLNIDDFGVEIPGGAWPGEWQVVEGVTENPYTINGLTAETNYEVQVQAIGEVNSDWSEAVEFTTLADTPAFLRGDVDNNGEVKIGDVTALISYLLSGDPTGINVLAADCDQNGEVKIGDVTALIAYLLSGTW